MEKREKEYIDEIKELKESEKEKAKY